MKKASLKSEASVNPLVQNSNHLLDDLRRLNLLKGHEIIDDTNTSTTKVESKLKKQTKLKR